MYCIDVKSFAVRQFCRKKKFSQQSVLFRKTSVLNTTTVMDCEITQTNLVLTEVYKNVSAYCVVTYNHGT